MESARRVGYHDFKAYTERLASGKYQGFVLVRHHTLAGIIQTVFRAGPAVLVESDAFASAELKVAALMHVAAEIAARPRRSLRRAA